MVVCVASLGTHSSDNSDMEAIPLSPQGGELALLTKRPTARRRGSADRKS